MTLLSFLAQFPVSEGSHFVAAIRVEGRHDSLDGVLRQAGVSPAAASSETRVVEQKLGWQNQVYLYLGVALPEFGDMAFAFRPELIPGEVHLTPFDTGGMVSKDICPVNTMEEQRRCSLVLDNRTPLATGIRLFAKFLLNFFEDAEHYLTLRRPIREDPYGIYLHPENDCRAWIWEVQTDETIPFSPCLEAWCIPAERVSEFDRLCLVDERFSALASRIPQPLWPEDGESAIDRMRNWQLTQFLLRCGEENKEQ